MNEILSPPPTDSEPTPVKLSLWRKIGGGALSIAVLFHVVLLIVGSIWIFTIIREPEKKVDFTSAGSSGSGERSAQSKQKEKQRAKITPTTSMKRVAVEGPSSLTLADPGDTVGTMASLGAIGGGGLSGGFGGGGKGKGLGEGTGAGSGISGLAGDPAKSNPFGMVSPSANALEGSYYDLTQTKNGQPTDMAGGTPATAAAARDLIGKFIEQGWSDKILEKYYKAPRTLYQSRILIPTIKSEASPTAFECPNVADAKWIVVYRGVVTPPKTGRYRFVGAGDDALVVRFNGKNVFDYGYVCGTLGKGYWMDANFKDLVANGKLTKETPAGEDLKKLLKRHYPMPLPLTRYTYPSTTDWNNNLLGMATGPAFEAEVGKQYPIDILFSEATPGTGGLSAAALLIEEVGAQYQKAENGSPLLPLFRLDSSIPEVAPPKKGGKEGQAPPFDPNGPVWKRVKGPSHREI